jgi:hypothetical protein
MSILQALKFLLLAICLFELCNATPLPASPDSDDNTNFETERVVTNTGNTFSNLLKNKNFSTFLKSLFSSFGDSGKCQLVKTHQSEFFLIS